VKYKLVSLGKYGFVIDNSRRKDYTKAKRMFVRESVAKKLVKARKLLPEGYNFKVFDGKRSIADQRKIIKICEVDLKSRYPKKWKELLVKYTGGYKSLTQELPLNTHRHGGAVDVTIIDDTGKELEMGGGFDDKVALNYYDRKKNLTKKEKKIRDNRKFLKHIMKKAGFEVYAPEWTHWGYSK